MKRRWRVPGRSLLVGAVLAGCAGLRGANASSEDWPHTRGPAFDGHVARDTPLSWPAQGPGLVWEQPVGQGFSGMVVAAGRIFTQHQTSSGQELLCLDLASGRVLWHTRYGFPWEFDGRYPGPYATPTVVDSRVYFSDCYGVIGCASAADGAILWRFDAVKKLSPGGVDFGYAAAPLVLGGRVYAPAPAGGGNTTGFCLNAQNGELLWQTPATFSSYASFAPLTVGGKECLLLPLRNGVAIYDRQTGAELWKEEWTRGYDEHSCWSVYREPLLFFPSAFRRAARVYRLGWTGDRLQVDSVWEERVLSNDVFSSALVDGHLYGFDVQSQQSDLLGRTRGALKCVELATGALRWTQSGIKHCSVTQVGSRLLLLEDEGDLVLVDPSPEAYREIARTTLPQHAKIWATPVIIGDRLLIRARDSVACYSLTGNLPAVAPRTARGPEPIRPSAAAISLDEKIRGWFERYRSDVFIAPSGAVLAAWYGFAVALLTAAFALGGLPLGAMHFRWVLPAALLGLIGTAAITIARGQFTFVAPLTLFALFCGAIPAVRDPADPSAAQQRGWRPVARLLVFLALCFAYYRACGWLFLVSGWGFLVGFPAVVLLAWLWQRAGIGRGKPNRAATALWAASAFSAYFWTSAVAVVWSAKG